MLTKLQRKEIIMHNVGLPRKIALAAIIGVVVGIFISYLTHNGV